MRPESGHLLRHPRSRRRPFARRARRHRRGGRVLSTHDRRALRRSTCELSPNVALDRDLAIHQARLGRFWLTEYRPWEGSSEGGRSHRRGALPALHPRLRAAGRPAGEHRQPAGAGAAIPARDARAGDRSGPALDRDRARSRPSSCPDSSTRSWPPAERRRRRTALARASTRRRTRPGPRSSTTPAWLRDEVLPARGGEVVGRTRALRGDGAPA